MAFQKAKLNQANDASAARRTPRRTYERLIGVLHKGRYALQRSSQISEGGMRLELPAEFEAGDQIVVTFILPVTLETVTSRAEVVHQVGKVVADKIQTGIKFVTLDTLKRRLIRDFVSSKPPSDKELDLK